MQWKLPAMVTGGLHPKPTEKKKVQRQRRKEVFEGDGTATARGKSSGGEIRAPMSKRRQKNCIVGEKKELPTTTKSDSSEGGEEGDNTLRSAARKMSSN